MKQKLYKQGIASVVVIIILLIVAAAIVAGVATIQKAPAPQEPILAPAEEVVEEVIKEESVSRVFCLPTDPPSITVLSPNGGEIFQAGGQMTVEWDSCNVISPISIILIKHDLSVSYTQSEGGGDYGGFSLGGFDPFIGTQDDGFEQLILPSASDPNLIPGQHYFISISGQDDPTIGSGFHPRDYSDNLFTIQ